MGTCDFFWNAETKTTMEKALQVDSNPNWNSEISRWIVRVKVFPPSPTENCSQDRGCRFELADSSLNFHRAKSILPPALGFTVDIYLPVYLFMYPSTYLTIYLLIYLNVYDRSLYRDILQMSFYLHLYARGQNAPALHSVHAWRWCPLSVLLVSPWCACGDWCPVNSTK